MFSHEEKTEHSLAPFNNDLFEHHIYPYLTDPICNTFFNRSWNKFSQQIISRKLLREFSFQVKNHHLTQLQRIYWCLHQLKREKSSNLNWIKKNFFDAGQEYPPLTCISLTEHQLNNKQIREKYLEEGLKFNNRNLVTWLTSADRKEKRLIFTYSHLLLAAQYSSLELLEYSIKNFDSNELEYLMNNRGNMLSSAAQSGRVEKVKFLLEKYPKTHIPKELFKCATYSANVAMIELIQKYIEGKKLPLNDFAIVCNKISGNLPALKYLKNLTSDKISFDALEWDDFESFKFIIEGNIEYAKTFLRVSNLAYSSLSQVQKYVENFLEEHGKIELDSDIDNGLMLCADIPNTEILNSFLAFLKKHFNYELSEYTWELCFIIGLESKTPHLAPIKRLIEIREETKSPVIITSSHFVHAAQGGSVPIFKFLQEYIKTHNYAVPITDEVFEAALQTKNFGMLRYLLTETSQKYRLENPDQLRWDVSNFPDPYAIDTVEDILSTYTNQNLLKCEMK